MGKTRNCRYTPEEKALHNEAVRLRKMTDTQLVAAVREAEKPKAGDGTDKLRQLLDGLANGECKGVKGATAYKIAQYAQEKGLI